MIANQYNSGLKMSLYHMQSLIQRELFKKKKKKSHKTKPSLKPTEYSSYLCSMDSNSNAE